MADYKVVGGYTLRGTVTSGTAKRIAMFDGKYDSGYILKEIKVCNQNATAAGGDTYLKVITDDRASNSATTWQWDDSREIAWASTNARGDTSQWETYDFVDPDNLIVEDIWVCATSVDGSYPNVNYCLVFDKVEITTWTGLSALVRNNAQDVRDEGV